MTITLNYTFYKNNTKKQGIVCREFLKGGTLSIDRLIKERAPPYSGNKVLRYIFSRFMTDSWWKINNV